MSKERDALAKRNVGENLDALMQLDPRGYGVGRILYKGSRDHVGAPIAMSAAEALCNTVQAGDVVFILTGFVLYPHLVPEMDGMVSSMLLARSLVTAFDAKPVIICPEDAVPSVKSCAGVVGLHVYDDFATMQERPLAMSVRAFTKDVSAAPAQAEALLADITPKAVISVEAPGANAVGVYHNAVGRDLSQYQAKTDVLWNMLRARGVMNIAIGDLGNEIGMGTIAPHIKEYIPFTDKGECQCGCGGGILAASDTDNIITATVSDWGCWALMASVAYLKQDMDLFHDEDMQAELMRAAARSGLIDMTGSLLPGIDGFDTKLNATIVSLMRQCTGYAVKNAQNFEHWFVPVADKHFFDK